MHKSRGIGILIFALKLMCLTVSHVTRMSDRCMGTGLGSVPVPKSRIGPTFVVHLRKFSGGQVSHACGHTWWSSIADFRIT